MEISNQQLADLITQQATALSLLKEQLQERNRPSTSNGHTNVPWPAALEIEKGDIAQNFENFVLNWQDYEIATADEPRKVTLFMTTLGTIALPSIINFHL